MPTARAHGLRSRVPRGGLFVATLASVMQVGCAPQPKSVSACPEASTKSTACVPREVASGQVLEWRSWSAETFAQAAAQDKLLLVDVGIEGCTACRWMLEDTYADEGVIARVNAGFIAVAVDAEARPDLGELYSSWGWPATIVLTPQGEMVFAMRGNKLPRNFRRILDELARQKAQGSLDVEALGPLQDSSQASERNERNERNERSLALRTRARAQLDRSYDGRHGGWGARQKMPLRAQFVATAARASGDEGQRARALQTAEAYANQLDPVWGGLYIAVIGGSWQGTRIVEKRIAEQAAGISAFANAYRWTGDEVWLDRIDEVDRYVETFLLDGDGAFFTSQEDDAPGLPADLGAREYYALDDPGRRAYGVPPVDHAVYTHKNAEMIRAYVDAFALTGDTRWRDRAQSAAEALWQERVTPTAKGAARVDQVRDRGATNKDARMRVLENEGRTYLEAQAGFGLALVELYSATGDLRWASRARQLGAHMYATLFDPKTGGYKTSDDPTLALAGLRVVAVESTGLAAHFALRLGTLDKDEALLRSAHTALAAGGGDELLRAEGRMIGEFALAAELLGTGLVEFSVVGDPEDPRAEALFTAAVQVAQVRALPHFEEVGRYPDRGRPSLWICSERACSTPIESPQDVAEQARSFMAAELAGP